MAPRDLSVILDIAAMLGLPVAEPYRDSVLTNYARLLEQAALVMAFPLPGLADDQSDFVP